MEQVIFGIYVAIVASIGILGTLIIAISECAYDMDEVLINKKEFLCCVFQFQVAVFYGLHECVKPCGIFILILLVSFLTLPISVVIFAILIVLEFLKFLIWAFMKVFGKEGE